MYKKYTTPCPLLGCEVVERHFEMAQPTKKFSNLQTNLEKLINFSPSFAAAAAKLNYIFKHET